MKKCIKKIAIIMLIFLICISSISIPSVKAQGGISKNIANCGGDGKNNDNTAGDQSKTEYRVKKWSQDTNHGGWKRMWRYEGDNAEEVRALIAQYAVQAANNDKIGYCYGANTLLTQLKKPEVNYEPSKITEACNADCSNSTWDIVACAGNKLGMENLKGIYKKSSVMASTPAGSNVYGFMVYSEQKYLTSADNLQPGDILASNGHVTIYVGNATSTSAENIGSNVTGGWEVQDITVDFDKQDFRYNGRPKDATYEGKKSLIKEILSSLATIIDYIVGFLFHVVTAAFVGIVELIESGLAKMLKALETTTGNDVQSSNADHYTIEDLVFNRIPALDVNIFSKTPGGKEPQANSPLEIIITMISAWYVTIRNISIIVMLLAVIISGIRMAIATTAEKKADYKEYLIRWIKALTLVFVVHYLIYFILVLNEKVVKMFANAVDETGENVIYNTIKTRAYDVRLSVGFPGTIMYITLFIYWLRFLWLYFKRYVRVLILIVCAPIVIAKYALSSSKKSEFDNWLSDFISNVIIQSVHALEYAVFFGIAVDLAKESVVGFIIALVFMAQILKLDSVVLGMISFRGSGAGRVKELKEHKPLDKTINNLVDKVAFPAAVAITAGNVVYGTGKVIGNEVSYRRQKADDKDELKYGYRPRETKAKERKKKSNARKNSFDQFMLDHFNKNGQDAHWAQIAKLKIKSRQGGKVGKIYKGQLKRYNKQQWDMFKNKGGRIGSVIGGTAEGLFALPLMATNWEEEGVPILFDSAHNIRSGIKGINKDAEENQKAKEKVEKTAKIVGKVDEIVEDTENKINSITDKDRAKKAQKEINKFTKLKANSSYIQNAMITKLYSDNNLLQEAENGNYNNLINETLKKVDKDSTLNSNEADEIKNKMEEYMNTYMNANTEGGGHVTFSENVIEEISKQFEDTIAEATVSEDNIDIAKNINEIKDLNAESIKNGSGTLIKPNMFTKELENKVNDLNNN